MTTYFCAINAYFRAVSTTRSTKFKRSTSLRSKRMTYSSKLVPPVSATRTIKFKKEFTNLHALSSDLTSLQELSSLSGLRPRSSSKKASVLVLSISDILAVNASDARPHKMCVSARKRTWQVFLVTGALPNISSRMPIARF